MLRHDTQDKKPGLVALYDIRPGIGADLFLQPRSKHGAAEGYDHLWVTMMQIIIIRVSGLCPSFVRTRFSNRQTDRHGQWRRSVLNNEVRVSQVKPSNCFMRLENLFYHPFLTHILSSLTVRNLQSYIQQQFRMKDCDILGGKTYSDPSCIFSGGQDSQPSGPTPQHSSFICVYCLILSFIYLFIS